MASDHNSLLPDYGPAALADGTSRVVGGSGVQPGAWPGIASIQATWQNGTWHMCSGVLLSSQWVLTVAHCFIRVSDVYRWDVVIGATDLTQPGPEAEVRHIQRLLVHQHYVVATARNDIALLELDRPVECSDSIQLGCVPDTSLRVSELKFCYIAGWTDGVSFLSVSTTPRPDVVLQEAKVHLMDTELCNSSRWYAGAVHPENLCAGYPRGGIDTCQGDSGGPLVCKDNRADYFWVVGLSSWGRGCDKARHPGIYTSTQPFYNWILVQTGLSPAQRAGPEQEPAVSSTPEQRLKPEPEPHISLTPEQDLKLVPEPDISLIPKHSQRPAPTSSALSMPTAFPLLLLVPFLNLLQEFLHFLKDKKA
ncbi:acrosin-like [Myiozetetes cayanensis]|uniref:acrosin-like n=1 Tax=Myiozetetes cayanensis TaxID=478635 RepID=UPI00215E1008|nr:acrosin-like [Myiozetetes cayanensis]